MTNKPNLTWIDVESTGVDAGNDYLLEVACMVTNADLELLDEKGFTHTVYYPDYMKSVLYEKAIPLVQNMHTATGLWDRLSTGIPLAALDEKLLGYIASFTPESNSTWLAGNSITLDRNFLQAYQPKSFEHLHHRSVDVTSLAGPAQWWTGVNYEKKKTHNAFDDIQESLEELKYLRKEIFNS